MHYFVWEFRRSYITIRSRLVKVYKISSICGVYINKIDQLKDQKVTISWQRHTNVVVMKVRWNKRIKDERVK